MANIDVVCDEFEKSLRFLRGGSFGALVNHPSETGARRQMRAGNYAESVGRNWESNAKGADIGKAARKGAENIPVLSMISETLIPPNAEVSDRSQPPLKAGLSLSEPAGSGSLHRRVRCSVFFAF